MYIYSLIIFVNGNQGKFLINSSVHDMNTINKHHLPRPIANLFVITKISFKLWNQNV
jgi:hypothetical protein